MKTEDEIKQTIKEMSNSIKIPTLQDIVNKINTEEHRHLIQEKDGTYREETDDEFKNRLIKKYESEGE